MPQSDDGGSPPEWALERARKLAFSTIREIAVSIAAARAEGESAERERCAKTAENQRQKIYYSEFENGWNQCASNIAHCIRNNIAAARAEGVIDERLRRCNAVGLYTDGGAWMPLIFDGVNYFDPGGLPVTAPKSSFVYQDWRGVVAFMHQAEVEYLRLSEPTA